MAYENPVLLKSVPASADLSTKQFLAVRLNGSGALAVCGAGEASVGPLQNKPSSTSQIGDYMPIGISRGISGAAFAEMDELASDSAGKYVKRTPGAALVAIALEAATAGDQTKAIFVMPAGSSGAPYFAFTIDAENAGANTILVHAQLKNGNGTNVAVATKYRATSYDAGAAFTDGGAGSILVGSTTVEIIGLTDATGLAQLTVTDTAAETVYLEFVPEKGVPTIATLIFA